MSYIGVDLDGTLAVHEKGADVDHIGAPIPEMVERVKTWLAAGQEVRIITARVALRYEDCNDQADMIRDWCEKHLGWILPVQSWKCGGMLTLFDDRAVEVVRNTGILAVDAARDTLIGEILTWIHESDFDPTDANTLGKVIEGIARGRYRK